MKIRSKNIFSLSFILVAIVFLFGCQVRTYTVLKERPDQEISGNRGYLKGEAPPLEREIKPRKTYVFEIEMGKTSSDNTGQ